MGRFTVNARKAILLAAVVILAAFFAAASAASVQQRPTLRYYGLDVGQGDSSLFILPDGRSILIDAGPEEAGRGVVRYLKSCGIKKIDLLIATHAHSDHIGGMRAVLSAFPVGKVWDSGFIHGGPFQKNFYKTVQKKNIPFGRPKRGYSEKFGDVTVEVIAPARVLTGTRRDTNNNCLVVLISYGKVGFLMTGDMEREQYATVKPLPKASVLKAAHHGSSNGTSNALLREVSPKLVVLSYGKGNSYGYPHKEVVKALADFNIKRFDTKDGVVKIRTDGENIIYQTEREVR